MIRALVLVVVLLSLLLVLVGCAAGPLAPVTTPGSPLPQVTPHSPALAHPTTAAPTATTAQTPTPALSGLLGGAVLIARDAAQAGNWDQVEEELDEAIELSADIRTKSLFSDLQQALAGGRRDEVLAELKQLAEVVSAETPLLTEMEDALRFAQIGDWEEVKEELNEALDLTQDLRIQRTLQEIIADLDRGQHEEVLHDLERLTAGVGAEDPAFPSLQEAMSAARAGQWQRVKTLLRRASDLTKDDQHLASIIEMLDDLDKGNHDEVVSDLSVLIGAHGQVEPDRAELQMALRHAEQGDWQTTLEKLQEAEALSKDSQRKDAIAALVEQLNQGQHQDIIAGLEALLQP